MVVHLRATGDVPILKQAKFKYLLELKSAAYGELISIGGLGLSDNGKLNSTITEIFETKLSLDSSRLCFKFYDVEVPCILGVNFYDKDLLEFLEQLAETDGSSTMPPFILRVLNFRACRGKTKISLEQLDMQVSTLTSELDSDLWYLLQEITQTSVREVFFIGKLYLFISMEQVRILMEGNIVAILGFGSVVQQCMEAANILKSCNIDVTVEDARFCKPLDAKLIRRLAKDMRS